MPKLTKKRSKLSKASKKLLGSPKQFRLTGLVVLIAILAVIGAYFILHIHAATCTLGGDANCDGTVNVLDLSVVASNFGKTTGMTWAQGDFNGDGAVNVVDLSILAAHWGNGGTINSACTYSTQVTPAFCETFDSPYTGTKTQTGDLNPVLWGVSRLGNVFPDGNGISPTKSNFCDLGNPVYPPSDVRICNGQMIESTNDGGDVVNLDTYPKQPFSFANRTGTVVFDVSANSEGIHAAWPEFAITDLPVPGTRRDVSQDGNVNATSPDAPPHAQNAVGFSLDGCGGPTYIGTTGVGAVYTVVNGVYNVTGLGPPSNPSTDCITDGSPTAMNHFEVQLSTTHIVIYGTDAGSTTLKKLVDMDLDRTLTFNQGLVWLIDTHYNALKNGVFNGSNFGKQQDHAIAWDNLGFDGPKTYRDLGFDVPYANQSACATSTDGFSLTCEGYQVNGSRTFTIPNVTWSQTPSKVLVVLNAYNRNGGTATVSASVNGSAPVTAVNDVGYRWESLSMTFPTADAAQGSNSVTISTPNSVWIGNLTLIMVAGAPVP